MMKRIIVTLLCLFYFPDNYCQENKNLRDYFFPISNTADTLFFNSKNMFYSNNKKVVKHIGMDTIEISEYNSQNEFTRSYIYTVSDKEVKVLHSKTNLKGIQIIDNIIIDSIWLSFNNKQINYDGRCYDTSVRGNWEWENRIQLEFRFDSVNFQNEKRNTLIVKSHNYFLNQPSGLSAKIFYMNYIETMTFVEGIGLIKIEQKGIDKINNFRTIYSHKKVKVKYRKRKTFTNVLSINGGRY